MVIKMEIKKIYSMVMKRNDSAVKKHFQAKERKEEELRETYRTFNKICKC